MSLVRCVLAVVGLLVWAGCEDAAPRARAAQVTLWEGGQRVAGATPVKLGELAARAADLGGQTVRVEGVVSGVCQHRGCWVEISDGAHRVIAKSLDHGIAFPRDAVGKRMIIEGPLRVGAVPSCGGGEHAQHAEPEGHSCPQPDLLVEVRGAVLLGS